MSLHNLPLRSYPMGDAVIGYDDAAGKLVAVAGSEQMEFAVRFLAPHDASALIDAIDSDPSNTVVEAMSGSELVVKQGSEALALCLAEKSPSGFGGADHSLYAGGVYIQISQATSGVHVVVEKNGQIVADVIA